MINKKEEKALNEIEITMTPEMAAEMTHGKEEGEDDG